MKKLIGYLAALFFPLALACGASSDPQPGDPQTHVIVHPEAQFDELTGWSAPPDPLFYTDGDEPLSFDSLDLDHDDDRAASEGDFGSAQEALSVPAGYGVAQGAGCPSSDAARPCRIGKDKEVRPLWGGGPTTHPATPGVDWKVEMGHAIAQLAAQGTNWTIVRGGSTSHDFVSGSGSFDTASAELLGQTRAIDISPVVCTGGSCTQKFNGFFIDLNPTVLGTARIGYCNTVANCQFYAEVVIQHEITHGMGMDHSNAAIGQPGSFMRPAVELNVSRDMNLTQVISLNTYAP